MYSNETLIYHTHDNLIALGHYLGGHIGYKQGGMGVIEGVPCIYGPMFGRGLETSGASISMKRDHLFGIEAEVGFVMKANLPPIGQTFDENGGVIPLPERSEEDVWAAVDYCVACIETVGTRLNFSPGATALEKISDASCAAGVVLGQHVKIEPEQLKTLTGKFQVNGEDVATGHAEACPEGSPLAALRYVANHLNRKGQGLKAGDLIIAGALCKYKGINAGDEVVCDIGALGTVRMTLVE